MMASFSGHSCFYYSFEESVNICYTKLNFSELIQRNHKLMETILLIKMEALRDFECLVLL